MSQIIDNATRFFTVVGAPYIAECHADRDAAGQGSQRNAYEIATLFPSCSTGSWLNEDR
jgi:hypothetical protein